MSPKLGGTNPPGSWITRLCNNLIIFGNHIEYTTIINFVFWTRIENFTPHICWVPKYGIEKSFTLQIAFQSALISVNLKLLEALYEEEKNR